MAILTLRQTGHTDRAGNASTNKGLPLTNSEADNNFITLDNAKLEIVGGSLNAMTGQLFLVAPSTSAASLNIPSGVASPTSPIAGDIWNLGNVLKYFNGSTTVDLATTDASGNIIATTATKWAAPITLSLSGDISGSASVDGSANVTINTTIGANTVALGTDTTGNYVQGISAGTGITVTNGTGEGVTSTISIPQAVGTTSNVQFGSIGVGMVPSGTIGRIDAANDVVAFSTSDARLKKNITTISDALEKVKKLNGVTFDWDEEQKDIHGYEGRDTGLIAQDVQEVLPEVVTTRDNGFMAVRYEKMIGLLVEAVKELSEKLDKCNCGE